MKPFGELRQSVLEREPKAGPLLDVIERYWGDGRLTEDLAGRFIAAYARGDYVQARKLFYDSAPAAALIEADQAENDRLRELIDQDRRLFDFGRAFAAALLKVALGVALAAVGL